MRAFCLVVGLAACGRLDFGPIESGGPDQQVVLAIAPVYPTAPDWNDYVANDGVDPFSASGAPCPADASSYASCLHAGELREVTVDGAAACDGLALTDTLGVFDWSCRVVNATATFYSTLASTKGLRDLVSAAGWNEDDLVLTGAVVVSSPDGPWWSNPIAELADNSAMGAATVTLAVPGEIYVVSASRQTAGYQIAADQIAVATLGTASLTSATGVEVIASAAHDQLWLEVALDEAMGDDAIALVGGRFEQIYRTSISHGGQNSAAALHLDGVANSRVLQFVSSASAGYGILVGSTASSDGNYFADVAIASPQIAGIDVDFGQRDIFDRVTVANSAGAGMVVGSYCDGAVATGNTFVGVRTFNNGGNGIYVNSESNRLVDVVTVGNGGDGIAYSNACGYPHGTVTADVVAAFNLGDGIDGGEHTMLFNNIVAIENGPVGFEVGGINTWSNLAVSDNHGIDINQDSNTSVFEAALLVAGPTSCANAAGLDGVTAGTCVPSGASTAQLFYQGSVMGDFVQAVTSDGSNASAVAGTAMFPGTADFDWLAFDNGYRVWGQWGGAGPWTAGTGAILDFRLRASGSKIFDNTGDVMARNVAFVAGGACPDPVDGDRTVTSQTDDPVGYPDQTYLSNAVEIVSPSSPGYSTTGNHDGLCESGESCLYTPSFGAYQGEGALATCQFTDGAVAGVQMYGYATDGI